MAATVSNRAISRVGRVTGGRCSGVLKTVNAAQVLAYAAESNNISIWSNSSVCLGAQLDQDVRLVVERIIEGNGLTHAQIA
jgi:hypothetical protein